MCMASLFLSLENPIPFAMAHCNFRLRAEESDGDEAFVSEWAERHGVRLHQASFDTEEYAAEHGISIEMAARELRYKWFAKLCIENGYAATAIAHNANDNAETLMLNLLRGAGLKGVSGMSMISDFPFEEGKGLKIIRPLLKFTRRQIDGYMFFRKESHREDSTNASSDYKRNLIRNEIFPLFERINPSFIATFNREMGYFSEAAEIVDDWCRNAETAISSRGICSIKSIKEEKHWKYLLFHMLEPFGFNSSAIASLEALLASERTISGKRFESPTHILLIERDMLRIVERQTSAAMPPISQKNENHTPHPSQENESAMSFRECEASRGICPVRIPGTYHFNGKAIKIESVGFTSDISVKQPGGILIFDADKLRFPFILRQWKKGDWMIPLGMKGRKKVSDIFNDLKYDSFMKSSSIILVDTQTEGLAEQQHIAALTGYRIDSRYRVTDSTTHIIRISIL